MTGRLRLIATSPRVAPGLLSGPAWSALHEATAVFAGTPDHPALPAVAEAGIPVQVAAGTWLDIADRVHRALAEGQVCWLLDPGDGGGGEVGAALAALPGAEAVAGSWDLPGARFLDLVAVQDRLRSPGGCPWDAEQTHASLIRHLVEEAYELVEAVETGDLAAMREELGDVLMQVTFHARIAQEGQPGFDIDDVAGDIVAKLVARHPHVFGDADAETAAEVEATWDVLKAAEKGRTSVTEGVPLAQPALALASKLLSRAGKAGLPVDVPPALALPRGTDAFDAVGAALLAAVVSARVHGVDAESALRAAARDLAQRIRAAEQSRQEQP